MKKILERHMEIKHPTEAQKLERTCPICQKVCKTKKLMPRHMKKHQKKVAKTNGCECIQCRKMYGTCAPGEQDSIDKGCVRKPKENSRTRKTRVETSEPLELCETTGQLVKRTKQDRIKTTKALVDSDKIMTSKVTKNSSTCKTGVETSELNKLRETTGQLVKKTKQDRIKSTKAIVDSDKIMTSKVTTQHPRIMSLLRPQMSIVDVQTADKNTTNGMLYS